MSKCMEECLTHKKPQVSIYRWVSNELELSSWKPLTASWGVFLRCVGSSQHTHPLHINQWCLIELPLTPVDWNFLLYSFFLPKLMLMWLLCTPDVSAFPRVGTEPLKMTLRERVNPLFSILLPSFSFLGHVMVPVPSFTFHLFSIICSFFNPFYCGKMYVT